MEKEEDLTAWRQRHLAALEARLAPLLAQPDGTVYDATGGAQHVRILKMGRWLHYYLVDPASGELNGPMSRIALDQPLHLLAPYTQAAMLALAWRPEPERVCVLGVAGGRLSLILYHHFPGVAIDNVDADPHVLAVAPRFFGLTFDERQSIAIEDARAFLEGRAAAPLYDIIFLDAFGAGSDALLHLATREFYELCGERLHADGVLCVNLLKTDARLLEKARTLLTAFRHSLVSEQRQCFVVFASRRARLSGVEVARRAAQIQRERGFDFPFVEHAASTLPARAIGAYVGRPLKGAPLLTDEMLTRPAPRE